LTIPNFITMARLVSVPLIVWLMIADRYVGATLLFIIAGISDAADGFIAKRFGASSELGAYLDPVATRRCWSPSSQRWASRAFCRPGWSCW
jgi:cardiolipin synthase